MENLKIFVLSVFFGLIFISFGWAGHKQSRLNKKPRRLPVIYDREADRGLEGFVALEDHGGRAVHNVGEHKQETVALSGDDIDPVIIADLEALTLDSQAGDFSFLIDNFDIALVAFLQIYVSEYLDEQEAIAFRGLFDIKLDNKLHDKWLDVILTIERDIALGESHCNFLHYAAHKGALNFVKRHIGYGAKLINTKGCYSRTPLHFALLAEHGDIVKELLAVDGILVNERDASGQTPLHVAVSRAQENAVLPLLVAGADCLIRDNNGANACDLALKVGHQGIMDLLLKELLQRYTQSKACHECLYDGGDFS